MNLSLFPWSKRIVQSQNSFSPIYPYSHPPLDSVSRTSRYTPSALTYERVQSGHRIVSVIKGFWVCGYSIFLLLMFPNLASGFWTSASLVIVSGVDEVNTLSLMDLTVSTQPQEQIDIPCLIFFGWTTCEKSWRWHCFTYVWSRYIYGYIIVRYIILWMCAS